MKTKWPAFGFGCLLLATAAVAVPPANAQGSQEAALNTTTPSSISNVEVARTGEQTTVRISGSGELRYQVHLTCNLRRVWYWTLRIRGWP